MNSSSRNSVKRPWEDAASYEIIIQYIRGKQYPEDKETD
jgi:hypothetical protein